MNTMILTIVIAIAVVIIAVLAGYAVKLSRQVKVVEVERQQRLNEIEEKAEEVMDEVAGGIRVLAQGFLNGDVTATEAALRIVGILDQLQLSDGAKLLHPSVFELADRTRHIPIYEEYQKLTPKERFKFDKERFKAEQELEEPLNFSMKVLAKYERPKFDDAAA